MKREKGGAVEKRKRFARRKRDKVCVEEMR